MLGCACVRDTPRIGIGRDVHTSHAHPPHSPPTRSADRPPTRHHPSCRWHSSTHRSQIEFRFATGTRGVLSRKRIRELGHWTNTGLSIHSVFPSPFRLHRFTCTMMHCQTLGTFFAIINYGLFVMKLRVSRWPVTRLELWALEGVVFGN